MYLSTVYVCIIYMCMYITHILYTHIHIYICIHTHIHTVDKYINEKYLFKKNHLQSLAPPAAYADLIQQKLRKLVHLNEILVVQMAHGATSQMKKKCLASPPQGLMKAKVSKVPPGPGHTSHRGLQGCRTVSGDQWSSCCFGRDPCWGWASSSFRPDTENARLL